MPRCSVRVLFCCAALALLPRLASAEVFRLGEVDGVVDVVLAYGLSARVEDRDPDFIGIANGGNADSVNFDDGDLNYDVGLISNQIRLTADLTLAWRNLGFFIRGYGFYDFETQLNDRARTELTGDGRDLVGAGGKLQEYYLSAQFQPRGIPISLRVGDQVINWGEGSFLRFGTDIINPIDFVQLLQPTAALRDIFVPQSMVWVATNLTETIAFEAFYAYDWKPVVEPPVGWFFSADDSFGGRDAESYFTGAGEFSDQGTDLSTVGGPAVFDEDFMRVPGVETIKPREQGQFGVTMEVIFPFLLNAGALGIHFVNYHARLPLFSGITADQATIDAAAAAPPGSETLTLGTLSSETSYVVTYPEDIQMLGLSFDTVTGRTGTLVALELSHHFNWPVQRLIDGVIDDALSPITDALGLTSVGRFGADERVSGIDETHKTQLSMSLAQTFVPRFWANEALIAFDVGWIHFDDLEQTELFDQDSWGYSLLASATFAGVFGGVNLTPFVGFTHDVHGVTPGPQGAFLEDRKSLSVGIDANWTNRITGSFSYVSFFGGKPLNAGADRDFVSFNLRYYY